MVGTIGIDDIIVPQRGEEDVEATDDLLKSQSHADAPDAADITDASDGADADTVAVMTEAQGGPEDGAEDGQDG